MIDVASAKASYAQPAISPDGSRIAFVSGGAIREVPAAGGAAHLLVADKGADSRPLFSPGGDKLAFVSDATGDGDIYLLELASGKLSRVTYADGRDELSGWSRDGQWIYFSFGRAGQGQRSGCGGRDAVAAVGALARDTLRAPRQVKP